MSRRHLTFECAGDTLAGTMDDADGSSGLLIVSGGNEIRSGAFGGQAALAARIAEHGFPVFRFDRRGVGDSEGENRGFRESHADIRAATAAFRQASPGVHRIVAFGNCDAASALMMMGGEGCDALVLSNPWSFENEGESGLPPPADIRARYLRKLGNPSELRRLLGGGVDLQKLLAGARGAVSRSPRATTLLEEMREGLAAFAGLHAILIAGADRTGQAFSCAWDDKGGLHFCKQASHAYVEPSARDWLAARILDMLRA